MLLEGKVAVVSGIGPGMGRDISLAFAREGASVALGGRTLSRLEEVAAEVEALGVRALPVVCDIADEASAQAAVDTAAEELGGIDILVNNAYDGGDNSKFMDADLDRWRRTMDVNLWGSLSMTRAVVPHMEARGDGRIIMINSMSVQRIQQRWGAYVASKSALAGVTKTLALELGEKGIRVNAIHPGYIYGDSVEWYFNHLAEKRGIPFQEVYDEVASETCLGYLPHSEEIAGTAVYFASDLAKPVTGQMIGVNAGHWFNG
ncbi:SDR family oxidoreductase [Aquihabitans sp. G128]|uniref:SDR family oxidoreductase n=1 Tax=Aquihabitans sp. G128 TaxID=2849779 RepID=UPI001C224956|nr:SDR family oxidoreductase [Aquihabitans sp. G128]QXC63031.1 SDR family oxidoreductase [Aquihabitans sp. G128]